MKNSLFLIFTSPLFYLLSALTVVFCGFSFFFTGQFFILGVGSTDLTRLFSAIPYIASASIPLFVERTKIFLKDESVPISTFKKFFSSAVSVSLSFLISILLLIFIPVSVSFFGDSDFPLFWTQFFGIALFVFSATSFSIMLSVFFDGIQGNFLISIMLSVAVLEAVNFLHLIPVYISVGAGVASILKFFSLSWHFDSFSKGIFNFSDIFFFLISAFLFLHLADVVAFRRKGGKVQRSVLLHKALFFALAFLVAFSKPVKQLKFDFSSGKDYSVAKESQKLLKKMDSLDSILKITYFCSKELDSFYPQSKNIADYLENFSSLSKKITFQKKNIGDKDDATLKNYGIKGQPLQITKKNRAESVFVYSAILLEFEGEKELIPFVLGIENLEFDLIRHLQHLVFGLQRNVILISGNDFSLENEYSFVEPWLKSRIFNVQSMNTQMFSVYTSLLQNPFPENNTALVVLGTKNLSPSEVQAIEKARSLGMNIIAYASKINADIMGGWTLEAIENDNFLNYLDKNGIILENSVVSDISNVPIVMESAETGEENYSNTINFPLWLSILPQENAKRGVTLSWSSPISVFGNAKPLLFTTDYAWKKDFNSISDYSAFVNPFTTYKTAGEAGETSEKLCVAATVERNSETGEGSLTAVSDQYFVSSILTGFISGENGSGDFRNFDFLAKELYRGFGDSEIVGLMEKSRKSKSLYKIKGEEEFLEKRQLAIFTSFGLPIFILILLWILVVIERKYWFFYFAVTTNRFIPSNRSVIPNRPVTPNSFRGLITRAFHIGMLKRVQHDKPNRPVTPNSFRGLVIIDSVLVAFLLLSSLLTTIKSNKNTFQSYLLPQKAEISKITISKGEEKTQIEKKSDFWIATDLNDERKVSVASEAKIKKLIAEMQKVRNLETVGKGETVKSNTGLADTEALEVSIFQKDFEASVQFGKSDTLTGRIYLKSENLGEEIYETENNFSSFLGSSINFWTDHSVFALLEKVAGYDLGSMTFGEILPLEVEPLNKKDKKIKSKSIESGFGRVLKLDFYEKTAPDGTPDTASYKVVASCSPSPSDTTEIASFLETFCYAFSINKLNGDQL